MLNVILSPKARRAIRNHSDYLRFSAKSPQSARAFKKEMDTAFKRIQQNPKIAQSDCMQPHIRIVKENRFHTYYSGSLPIS